jgi:molybdopterin-synthase adenylyltransferase
MNQHTNFDLADRDLRQRNIIPPERLAVCRSTVVGVGAIGRQVALQLAAMGIPWLQLIDPDTVEAVNLAPQGYLEDDLGRSKVSATAVLCQQMHHRLETVEYQERFRRSLTLGNVFFCCVDSIETRRLIWQAVKDRVDFFCDGRMSAEVLRVLTAADAASYRHYPTTLFAAAEAYAGACTAQSTIYCANIAAGLMVAQFAKFLRKLPVEADVQVNLLASEVSVADL